MTPFLAGAAFLLALVAAILLPPLFRPAKTTLIAAGRREANLAIFRDQLAELERDRAEGALAEADFIQAKDELQRRVLEDVQPDAGGGKQQPAPLRTAVFLALTLPLAAAAGYALLGNPRGLDPLQTQVRVTPQQMEEMVGKLAEKLKRNPDDIEGWIMLARSYKVMGRFEGAVEAYSHLGARLETDAALLADYADVLAQTQGGTLAGKPTELAMRALKLDPNEAQALLLAGAAASERRDFSAAAGYWERLLKQVDPESEDARALEAAIKQARQMVAAGDAGKPDKSGQAEIASSIAGEITLDKKLADRIKPEDVLFVFARPEGSRMPLAVIRTTAAELPLRFRLDDSNSLPGGAKLSAAGSVSVEARIARSGEARKSSGDLFGVADKVRVGTQNIRLRIDQVQP